MEKKTVLMVHNYYQVGGGEHTVFENETAMLQKYGHKVIPYTRSNDELKTEKWKLLLVPFSTIWSFKTFREVRKIIQREGVDIVHCHNTFPLISPSVYYAARSLKIPVVQTIHNFRLLCPNGLFYCDNTICEKCHQQQTFFQALKHKCYRNSLVQTLPVVAMLRFHRLIGTYRKISYIFLTEFNKQKFSRLIDIHGNNVFVKPNFVPDNGISHAKKAEKKFVFAGRLDENKGIRFLLEAWKGVSDDYALHIYGDGLLRPLVEAAAAEQENIQYFGFQSRQRIAQDIAGSMACVFPSLLYEGFPMSIAEAFQLDCPVIASDIGNPRNVVENAQAGAIFHAGDQDSFASALRDVVENQMVYAKNAGSYYQDVLSEDANYRMLERIYASGKHID